jgi:hypothetical protein
MEDVDGYKWNWVLVVQDLWTTCLVTPFTSLQLDVYLVCTVQHGNFANPSVLIRQRAVLIPKTLFNYSSHLLNLRCFSYLHRYSFSVTFSRSFVSRTPLFRSLEVTHIWIPPQGTLHRTQKPSLQHVGNITDQGHALSGRQSCKINRRTLEAYISTS